MVYQGGETEANHNPNLSAFFSDKKMIIGKHVKTMPSVFFYFFGPYHVLITVYIYIYIYITLTINKRYVYQLSLSSTVSYVGSMLEGIWRVRCWVLQGNVEVLLGGCWRVFGSNGGKRLKNIGTYSKN